MVPIGVKIISVLQIIGSIIAGVALFFAMTFLGMQFGGLNVIALLILALVLLVIVALCIFIGVSLWKGKNWARRITIIFAVIGAVVGILSLLSSVTLSNLINIVINAMIAGYLWFNKEVKEAFA